MEKKIKILICAFACLGDPDKRFGFGKGGESGLGWNIIKQINKFAEVFVLTEPDNKKDIEGSNLDNILSNVNFYYVSLPKILFFTKKIIQIYAYLWQIKAYFVAKKLHKEIKFDVFHHVTYANDWMASYIGALLPIPYLRGPGGGAHRVPEEFLKTYSLKDRLANNIRSFGQWIFKRDPFFIIGQNRAKAILVCNQEAYNGLPKKWKKKALFFPVNGIEIKKDITVDRGKNSKIFSILTAGKLLKIKGFDLAIKVFKEFLVKVCDANLIIVGDGPELPNLKILAERAGIGDRVIFKSWMYHENMMEEMNNSDIFLFCSLRDGGGAVVVEAMAKGKPVVCFDIAGPGFHVDENCGIKIKPDNPEQSIKDMAKALEELYYNKELRLSLGIGAKIKVELEYDWDKLGERLRIIYKDIAENNS